MNIFSSLIGRVFSGEIHRQVMSALKETDETFVLGRSVTDSDRDRLPYDRENLLKLALEAWRENPLARRIVGLTTQYVVGNGLRPSCKHQSTEKFLKEFWDHRINRLTTRTSELCDELSRTGNLFVLISTDAAGMSYIRAFPASLIKKINTNPNDIETAVSFDVQADDAGSTITYLAYNADTDHPGENNLFAPVMLHYAINRPVGATWGESDLAPLLKWLSRYANWLEDRARLNRYRNTFLYHVKGKFNSEAERKARESALNAKPPTPGSILVTDETETWEILAAKLESSDANEDGLALKRMIAAGAALPMHFLAEPESSTRTTAEASGGPTYRYFEQRQRFFLWVMADITAAVLKRRKTYDRRVKTDASFSIDPSDISGRDNVAYAMAASNIIGTLKDLRDRGLIDDEEMLRMYYRFIDEPVDVTEMIKRGKAAPSPVLKGESEPIDTNTATGKNEPIKKQEIKVDPATGEPKNESNLGA